MTRARWTGVAGVLFGIAFFAAGGLAGSTPDNSGARGAEKYAAYWNDSGHQDRARISAFLLSYTCVLLVLFAAGLRDRLRTVDTGPLPSFVLAAGATAAALIAAGGEIATSIGIVAGDAPSYKVDGSSAMQIDAVGYAFLATGLMTAAAMAVTVGLVTLRTRLLPVWTAYLGFLLGLGALGSYFSAWTGFFLLPIWSVVVGVVLLMRSEVRTEDRELVGAAA